MAGTEKVQGALQSDEADHPLVKRLQAGDAAALDVLFRRHVGNVHRQAVRLLSHEAEAEEVVQEVFLTLFTKADTFRGEAALSTWLYRLTVNAALSRLRRRQHRQEISLDDSLPRFRDGGHHLVRPVVDWSHTCEEQIANAQMQQLLQQAIEQLPPAAARPARRAPHETR
jgi:RNA polymerase sigma-70 factor, ECF subfamily